MPTYYVNSGAAGANNGTSWTDAYTVFGSAVTAASTDGDIIKVHVGHAEALALDTTYSFAAAVAVVCVDKDNSDALAIQNGTSQYIGHTTTNRFITIDGSASEAVYIYGLAFRVAGSTVDLLSIGGVDAAHIVLESCYLWLGNTSSTALIRLGSSAASAQSYVELRNCILRFGNASQSAKIYGRVVMYGCVLSADGTAPTSLFSSAVQFAPSFLAEGCNFSALGSNNLVGDETTNASRWTFANCKLGASFSLMAAQTVTNLSSAEVWIFNCHSGDVHYYLGHKNALGETSIDTGIYATSNIADTNLSWKIVGTANATFYAPYMSPWIDVYHTGTSAITPSLECVRSGSDTAYNNDTLWSEWSYQGTSGFPLAVFVTSDRMTPLGSAAAQTTGALGAGDWTGENATSWFGKLAPAAAFTPVEVGHIRARVCVAGANTVYVDPQIRGLA